MTPIYDMTCSAHGTRMSFQACIKRQALARTKSTPRRWLGIHMDEACVDCETGREAIKQEGGS